MQGSNGIFDSFRHCIYFALFRNVLVTDNSFDSGFHTGEILVVILLQSICLGNGCVNLCVISILVLQGSNGIFNSLRHCIHFALFSDILVTDNSIDGGFHAGEVLVVVLVQCVCFGNGCVNLCVICILVLQSSNRIFDSLCHLVYFGLLRNIFTTDNSLDSSFHGGEILVLILVQGIRFGNGCVNLCVISILVLQGSNGIFNSLCHCINLALLSNVFVSDNGIHSGFYSREVLVVVLVQCVCLSNGCINLGVVGR